MNPDKVRMGYLLISTPLPNTYIGGAMVTDGRGLPIEFRYTEPIQPTRIQQILYGQVLSSYIKREVILETLLKSLDAKFSHLLVEDDNLLDGESVDNSGFVVIRIGETKSAKIGKVGDTQQLSPTEVLLQVTREGSPLRLQLPPHCAPDPAALTGEGGSGPASTLPFGPLIEAGQTMDLYEPLKRIEKALETICQEAGILEKV